MKKSITALFLGMLTCANAQTTLYSQDFEGNDQEIFDAGWEVFKLHPNSTDGRIFQPDPSTEGIGFTGKTMGSLTFTEVFPITHNPFTDVAIRSENYYIPDTETSVNFRIGRISIGGIGSSHCSIYVLRIEEFLGLDTPAALKGYLDTKTPAYNATIDGFSSMVSIDLSGHAQNTVALIFRLHNSPTNTIWLFDDVTVLTRALGTTNFDVSQFAVYPNPASNTIKVDALSGSNIDKITIADMNGRIIKTKNVNGLDNIDIDINDIASGTYLMGISSDKGIVTKKIVKI